MNSLLQSLVVRCLCAVGKGGDEVHVLDAGHGLVVRVSVRGEGAVT